MDYDKLIIEILELVECNMVGIMDKKTVAEGLETLFEPMPFCECKTPKKSAADNSICIKCKGKLKWNGYDKEKPTVGEEEVFDKELRDKAWSYGESVMGDSYAMKQADDAFRCGAIWMKTKL